MLSTSSSRQKQGDVEDPARIDSAGDQEKATALLDESLAISTELGMRPLMELVLSRRGH